MYKISTEADTVFQQDNNFEFILIKNRFGTSGHKVRTETVENLFRSNNKVGIINERGTILSQNFNIN